MTGKWVDEIGFVPIIGDASHLHPKPPNRKPVSSESLADGKVRHTLEDGRIVVVGDPDREYRLEYLASYVGSFLGETYEVNVLILGPGSSSAHFEAWNCETNETREYLFEYTVGLTHIATGHRFTAQQLKDFLRPLARNKRRREARRRLKTLRERDSTAL